jgi:hypothetical protein
VSLGDPSELAMEAYNSGGNLLQADQYPLSILQEVREEKNIVVPETGHRAAARLIGQA